MSFNIRLPIDRQPKRAWIAQAPVAAAAIKRSRADVIGLQELFRAQGDDLVTVKVTIPTDHAGRSGRPITSR